MFNVNPKPYHTVILHYSGIFSSIPCQIRIILLICFFKSLAEHKSIFQAELAAVGAGEVKTYCCGLIFVINSKD
jgi:hypothetical protein